MPQPTTLVRALLEFNDVDGVPSPPKLVPAETFAGLIEYSHVCTSRTHVPVPHVTTGSGIVQKYGPNQILENSQQQVQL